MDFADLVDRKSRKNQNHDPKDRIEEADESHDEELSLAAIDLHLEKMQNNSQVKTAIDGAPPDSSR